MRMLAGQDPRASAKHSRHDEQMILVDEPGPDGVGGKGRTSHRNIERRLSLQLANRLRVEWPLQRVFGVETVSRDLE